MAEERRERRQDTHSAAGRWAPVEKPADARGTLWRLSGYVWRQRAVLLGVTVLVAISSVLGVLGPYLMQMAIDVYMAEGDLAGLGRLALGLVAVYGVGATASWLQAYIMAAVAQDSVRELRQELFTRMQKLPLRFFDRHTHGELMSRLTNDMDNVSRVLADTVVQLVSSVLGLVGVTVMMFVINWRLALVTLGVVPLMAAITRLVSRRTRAGFRIRQEHLGELNGMIEETVTGHRVVQAYAREAQTVQEFEAINRKLQQASVRAQVFAGLVGPTMNFVNNAGYAVVAGAGGWMALHDLATVGQIAAFISYARQFSWPLNQMAQLYNQIQSALAGAERVFAVLDETPEADDAPEGGAMSEAAGDVVFEQVDFHYEPGTPVLRQVNLHATPGQIVALVGPTGAGKTTIVNLLTRFYDITGGAIRIDRRDIRDVPLDDLRRQLGIVLQDTFLFGIPVMENIRYGRLGATDDEVVTAARLANADSFIRHLPHGYATVLAENGSNLSQGQRQLLAIARAVLAAPRILILDEATSSVDTRTERHIQEAMLRLMQGRTSFVIAHRLSTIRQADQILVLDGGRIVEQGRHGELLARRGFYARLYDSQFQGRKPGRTGTSAVADSG